MSVVEARVQPSFYGAWAYAAGVSGTRSITGRAIAFTAYSLGGGSMTINGGDTVPIPANVAYYWTPMGELTNPTVVFTGTDTYAIEFVT